MKTLVVAAVMLCVGGQASAAVVEVYQMKLKADCSFETLVGIKNEMNAGWGKANGYSAQILAPVHGMDLNSVYWVGTSATASVYGKVWDNWATGQFDPKSDAGKLGAKIAACVDTVNHLTYDTY
jgi:hypothetical protein